MRYMIVEHFRNGDAAPVYARFRERGRMAPEGLHYVDSWVTDDLAHCFQIMECDDRSLIDQWLQSWNDLVDCEVHPIITSKEAQERVVRANG